MKIRIHKDWPRRNLTTDFILCPAASCVHFCYSLPRDAMKKAANGTSAQISGKQKANHVKLKLYITPNSVNIPNRSIHLSWLISSHKNNPQAFLLDIVMCVLPRSCPWCHTQSSPDPPPQPPPPPSCSPTAPGVMASEY